MGKNQYYLKNFCKTLSKIFCKRYNNNKKKKKSEADMRDPRLNALADVLVNYSVHCQKGEKVLIEARGIDAELVLALTEKVFAAGGYPFVDMIDLRVERALLLGTGKQHCSLRAKYAKYRMEDMDCYIGIRGGDNTFELSDVPADKMQVFDTVYSYPVHHETRVKKTKWVVLRYPNPAMAQNAGTSTQAFENFYFDVCTLDYSKMDRAMDALKAQMERTDRVRILGPGTDLRFSVRGIPAIKCAGHMNIPDGEVYTAPVRESVEGTITYNAPTLHNGVRHENVRLVFKRGKIVEATSSDTAALNAALDTDEGARYVGEFAIGVNPYVQKPMLDILFDEKIAGSIHFTPGCSYEDADNGNRSALHWDMVLIQTPEYGGGEIYFDDVLIRKDGRFVAEPLLALNPENLR